MANGRRGARPAGRGATRSRDRTSEWTDAEALRRRSLRRYAIGSALAHAGMLAVLCWAPVPRARPALPGVVSVDLVAMAGGPSAPAPAPAPAAAPARPAPQPPAPAEPPKALPEPAAAAVPEPAPKEPPRPRAPTHEAVLPKEPRRAKEEAKKPKPPPAKEPKPEPPKVAAKPAPARPATPPKPKPRPQESYEDVLADLRRERGESRPEQVARAAPPGATGSAGAGPPGTSGAGPPGTSGPGQPLDAEIAAWLRAAQYHVEQAWVLPPGFQREALLAVVSVRLDAEGRVRAEPRIVRRSGNPWYDESVVRAIQKASPLPPPPEAGDWQFEFRPPGGAG